MHWLAISWRRSTGAGLVNVGLRNRFTVAPTCVEPLLEAVEEDVAARLADVEQPDGVPVEAGRSSEALPLEDGPLSGGVEQDPSHTVNVLALDRRFNVGPRE